MKLNEDIVVEAKRFNYLEFVLQKNDDCEEDITT